MLSLLSVVALAGDDALLVERGLVSMELEHHRDALRLADQALAGDAGSAAAAVLRYDALAAGHLAPAGSRPAPDPSEAWGAELAALASAPMPDRNAILAAATALLDAHPDHPEVIGALWEAEDPKVLKSGAKLLARATESTPATDPVLVYRMRRLAARAGAWEVAERLGDELVARGEPDPPDRAVLDRLGREDLALELSQQGQLVVPELYPSEVVEVGDKLEKLWTLAARYGDLAAAWEALQARTDGSTPTVRAARAWLAANDLPRATADVEAGWAAAGGAREIDLASTDDDRLRTELGEALIASAHLREASGDEVGARGDYGAAVLLRPSLLDPAFGERLDHRAATLEVGLPWTAGRGGTAVDSALAAASVEADPVRRRAILAEARFLALSGMGNGRKLAEPEQPWGEQVARTYALDAEASAAAGDHARARSSAVVGTLLLGRRDAALWALRGHEQLALGERDAAFVSLAVARALGAPIADQELVDLRGAGWEAEAAPYTAGLAREAAAAPGNAVSRGGSRPAAPTPAGSAPRLGEPFPPLVVQSDAGTLSIAAMKGRVVVVTALTEDCADCMRMMPAFALVVRKLRADGTDVALVVLSLDEREEAFQRVQTAGRSWGQVVRAVELREEFGIRRLPTTWVVDREGTTRYYFDHWLSADELRTHVENLD